jgi:hypothetical protein
MGSSMGQLGVVGTLPGSGLLLQLLCLFYMHKQAISGHVQAAGVGKFIGVLGGPGGGVWICSVGCLQQTCMPLLPWLCIEICVCLVCLLQQSFCKTQSRTQTSGNTFTA